MCTVQEIESAIEQLPRDQMRLIQAWLDNMLEDEMEFTNKFKASIERGKRDLSEGRARREVYRYGVFSKCGARPSSAAATDL